MKKAATVLLGLVLIFPTIGVSQNSSKHRSSGKAHSDKKGKVATTAGGKAPKGAKAKCGDGTYSSSSGKGTCSHHGGVDTLIPDQP